MAINVPNLNFADGDPLTSEKLGLLYQFILDTYNGIPNLANASDPNKPTKVPVTYSGSTAQVPLSPDLKSVSVTFPTGTFTVAPDFVVVPRYSSANKIPLFYHVGDISASKATIYYYVDQTKITGNVYFDWVANQMK
jgi:hypothetical protein